MILVKLIKQNEVIVYVAEYINVLHQWFLSELFIQQKNEEKTTQVYSKSSDKNQHSAKSTMSRRAAIQMRRTVVLASFDAVARIDSVQKRENASEDFSKYCIFIFVFTSPQGKHTRIRRNIRHPGFILRQSYYRIYNELGFQNIPPNCSVPVLQISFIILFFTSKFL